MRTQDLPESPNIIDRRAVDNTSRRISFTLSGVGLGLARLANAFIGRRKARYNKRVDDSEFGPDPSELTATFERNKDQTS